MALTYLSVCDYQLVWVWEGTIASVMLTDARIILKHHYSAIVQERV